MNINNSALVLFSGGQDSTVCLFWALQHFEHVEAVCFRYGQRHKTEIDAARSITEKANVTLHLIDAEIIAGLSANSLTNSSVMMDKEQKGDTPPNTFVPGRNLLFINLAAVIAYENHIANIITGVSQTDYSGYPDCRDTFIRSLNVTLNLAMDTQFIIHTPLMWLDKEEVWELADRLGVFDLVRHETVTCYHGVIAEGCGDCPSCKLRSKGLEKYIQRKNN